MNCEQSRQVCVLKINGLRELTLANGKPKIWPMIGSTKHTKVGADILRPLGQEELDLPVRLVAFLCQSEALLANVEQFAAESRVKRTINHVLVLPWTVALSVRTSPTPPDCVRARASIPTVLKT